MSVKPTRRGRPLKNPVSTTKKQAKENLVSVNKEVLASLNKEVNTLREAISIAESRANNVRKEAQQSFLSSVKAGINQVKHHCSEVEQRTDGLNYEDVNYCLDLFSRLLEKEYSQQ